MSVSASFLAVYLLMVSVSLPAKDKSHAPLPQRVIAAKTVYIDNQSDDASIREKAYDELKKWGRFQVVLDKAKADLVFVFAAGEYTSYTTNNAPYAAEVKEGYTYLTIVEAQSGEHLWNASQKWGNVYGGYHSATRGLIKALRKQIEEQAGNQTCCSKRN